MRRNGVDFQMGGVMVAGGIVGSGLGAMLFRILERLGQIDTVISITYVVMLGSIGSLMARESWTTIHAARTGSPPKARKRRHHPLVAALPLRTRFYRSGLYISPLAPLLLGFFTGILTILLGIGGLGVAFLLPPFAESVDPVAYARFEQAPALLARPAGGLAPGGSWRHDGVSWTPTTATWALTAAACGDETSAVSWLRWLEAHRTAEGSLPEKVLADGRPAAVAPLAWTAAAVVLTADQLARS